jgi:carboxymethylenebutenolidase
VGRLQIQIPAADGTSHGTLHVPDGRGPWPGVLMYPDAGGIREVFGQMGDRLAGLGYVTLIPDIYYRAGHWEPFDVATLFTDPAERARLGTLAGPLTNDRVIADALAYAGFLLARPEVAGTAIGTTGYCLGGRMSLVASAGLGGTAAAAASFHGGGLAVVDNPASPHLAAAQIRAAVYVAAATDDSSFTPEQAQLLDQALTGAGVQHVIEVYPVGHGFAVPDNPTYDAAAAERHWQALSRLYGERLGAAAVLCVGRVTTGAVMGTGRKGRVPIGARVRQAHLDHFCPGGVGVPVTDSGPIGLEPPPPDPAAMDGNAARAPGQHCSRCGQAISARQDVRRHVSGGWVHEACPAA